MVNNNIKLKIKSLYLGVFFLAISEAIIAYVQSTYLNQYFNISWVSFIFIGTYAVTFIVINNYSNLIARFNNYKTALAALAVKAISLLIFILTNDPFLIFLAFIFFTVSFNLIFINFDIFLEAFSADSKTGRIRGTFFTVVNFGWLISPLMAGVIMDRLGFDFLFSLALALTALVALILSYGFRDFTNHYQSRRFEIRKTFSQIFRRKNLRKIFYCAFILHFFYAIMIIYSPIYLNQHIGFSWEQIGLMFTFMLLPFVLLQYPAGYLADKYWGEQEILTFGLIVMSVSSVLAFMLNSSSLFIWTIILLLGRIGASLVEIMRESYFFKKVDAEDIELINALRSMVPLSYIVAPLIAGVFLYFLPLNYVFLFLSIIILTGIYPALTLKDTK